MADITWVDVTNLAPELSTVAVTRQTFILARVNAELSSDIWGTSLNMGRTYLAAHLATMMNRSPGGGLQGPLTGETAGAVSHTFGMLPVAWWTRSAFGLTVYGLEYLTLLRQFPATRFTISS